jgi:hypothetical protein
MIPTSPPQNSQGYALFVRPENARWTWTVMTLDGVPAARGEAQDRATAWRTGEFAAASVGALSQAARRRF